MPDPSSLRAERLSAAFVGLGAFGVFVATLCPDVFWLDSPELVAASHTLGGVHPPGHPVYVILAKLASLLPVGSVAIRVNLLSALFGAASLAILQLLALRALRGRRRANDGLHALAVAAGVLVFGLSPALWFQSVRAEVYTLNLFLCLAPLLLVVDLGERTARGGAVLAAAFLAGLGLGNHHLLVVLALPALLWLLLASPAGRRWLRPGRLALLFAVGLFALLPYALLPLRARLLPDLAWGDPSTPSGFLDVVSARVFQASMDPGARAEIGANLFTALALFADQLTPVFLGAGAVGVALVLRRRRRLGVALLLLFLGSLVSKVLMFMDPQNPDDHGYFSAALAVLALGAGVALGALASGLRRFVPGRRGLAFVGALLGAVLAAATLYQFRVHRPETDLSGFDAPTVVTQASLEAVPPRALVMPYYYALHFVLQYAQTVEERRPDVDLVHQSFHAHIDGGRPYRAWMREKVRGGEDLARAWEEGEVFPSARVSRMARGRPVYVEAFTDLVLPPERLEGLGILARVLPEDFVRREGTGTDSHWRAVYWATLATRLGDDLLRHRHTRSFVLWYLYLETALEIRQGTLDGALDSLARSRELSPETRSLVRLERWLEGLRSLPREERLAAMRSADLEAIARGR